MIFLVLGLGQGACYLFLLSLGNLRHHIIACEYGFFAAFLLYAVTLFLLRTKRTHPQDELTHYHNHYPLLNRRRVLISILFFSVFFRMVMWLSPPTLSDDVYRYLWEGRLLSAQINPFEYAPSDPALEYLRDPEVFSQINHKHLSAIYPPLNLFIFRLSTQVHPTTSAMNMTFILFDVLTMVVLIFTLHTLRLNLTRVTIYAWNPLVIMEFAGSGHLDSAGIFFLFLAFYFFINKKKFSATFSLALSFLSKFFPLMFLPFMLTRKKVIHLFLFVLVGAVSYLPFLSAGEKIFQSLILYAEQWVFNASLYDVFLGISSSHAIARGISAAFFLLIAIGLFAWYTLKLQQERVESIYLIGFISIGSLFLLTPVLHPWYLCWIVPFLVIYPHRAWILLSGSVFLSYWVLKGYVETGIWKESVIVKMVEYLPFYGLLLYDAVRRYRTHLKA